MHKKGRMMTLAGVLALQSGVAVAVTATGPTELHVTQEDTVLWSSVTSASPTLKAYFPTGATRAELSIKPMLQDGNVVSAELTPSSPAFVWHPFTGTVPSKDEIYSLELTYYTGSDELSSETAQLAVVSGAFGPLRVLTDTTSGDWRNVMGESSSKAIAIAYDAGWAGSGVRSGTLGIEHGAQSEAVGISGLSGWYVFDFRPRSVWTAGAYELSLSAGGASLVAEIERMARGLTLIFK